MLDECFPNQFHQSKSRYGIVLGMTHETPKDVKIKLHNWWAFSQWSSKWSTISPQRWHNALVHKIKLLKSQVITRKDAIPSNIPNKTGNTPRSLSSPNTLPRKDNKGRTSQLVIKCLDVKIPIRLQLPISSSLQHPVKDYWLPRYKERSPLQSSPNH